MLVRSIGKNQREDEVRAASTRFWGCGIRRRRL